MTNEELTKLRADLADLDARRAHDHDDPVRLANPLVAMFDESTVRKLLEALDASTARSGTTVPEIQSWCEEQLCSLAIYRTGNDLLAEVKRLRARIEAAGNVVSDNGCDCACDHATLYEDHDEGCEVCVVCRVADALWPEAGR